MKLASVTLLHAVRVGRESSEHWMFDKKGVTSLTLAAGPDRVVIEMGKVVEWVPWAAVRQATPLLGDFDAKPKGKP